jgi:two-component system cell cycle response regulator DivK
MRILYVEDNEANQALVGRVIRAKHHSIVYRDEGEGALELLAADTEIDLILLDIELAGAISGLDVVKTLRGRDDHRPIVAVTAYAMMGDRERILAAGCDQYLPKPLVITDLMALMEHYESGEPLPASMEAAVETPVTPLESATLEAPVTLVHTPLVVPETPAAAPEATPAPETPAAVVPEPAAKVEQTPPAEEKIPVPIDVLSVVSEIQAPQTTRSDGNVLA